MVLATIILLPGTVVQVRKSMLADVLPWPLDALWCALLMLSPEILVGVSALAFALKRDKPVKRQVKPPKPPVVVIKPPLKPTVDDWRAIIAQLDTDDVIRGEKGVQSLLNVAGFAPASPSTARRWALMTPRKESDA